MFMYKIKENPGDFIVEEVTDIEPRKKGQYSLWWMKKKDITTADAVSKIARKLHIKRRFIGFAGAKDKRAITKQLISISRAGKSRVERLNIEGIDLEFYGFSENPVSLGDLEGNNFEIIVRDVDVSKKIENKKIKNFFGEQRFSEQNADIGRAMIKKNFKTAAEKISESYNEVKEHLKISDTDHIGALRRLDLKILKIYVHAYQSFLWNKIAEQIDDDIELPLIGFDTELNENITEIVEVVMKEEGITYRDFIIKQIPELSCSGAKRDIFVKPQNFKILEKGEDKIRLKFFLPKGSYATEVIRQMFS